MNRRTTHHTLYGDIPLIERTSKGIKGTVYTWFQYDPAFKPELPRHAVEGDVARQIYCVAHDVPKYFYVDEQKTCVQCRQSFVFSAEEQKFWYESLQFNFNSTAIRCRNCRRQKQSERALREQIAQALQLLSESPNAPGALLDLARATVRYRERTGQGNLDRAIAAARRASREWPESAEPAFWEGKCHHLAGRRAKAETLLTQFIEATDRSKHLKKLRDEAQRELHVLRAQKRRDR